MVPGGGGADAPTAAVRTPDVKKLVMTERTRAWLAELVGTFVLVLGATASAAVVAEELSGSATMLIAVLGSVFALAAGVYMFYDISGAQFNPVVTLALFALRKISLLAGIGNVVAQLIGAILATGVLALVIPLGPSNYGLTVVAFGTEPWQAVVLEAAATFVLVSTILFVAVRYRAPAAVAAIAIPSALAAGLIISGALTGGSLNPARTLGPALFSGQFADHWVYWAGPIAGALVAALVFAALTAGPDSSTKSG